MRPVVSAIMPTRGRPDMAWRAVECWGARIAPGAELVIVDDRDDPSFRDVESFASQHIQYVALTSRLTVGAKRNLACQIARGEYIIHFDSDDWSAPGRIADQVGRLAGCGMQVTGYSSMLFRELRAVQVVEPGGMRPAREWWRMRNRDGLAAGASLCYRRPWWEAHPFPDCDRGEDDIFYAEALRAGVACAVDGGLLMYARNHDNNVSGRIIAGDEWEELEGNPYAGGNLEYAVAANA